MDHSNKTYPEAIETIANFLSIEIPRDKEATKIYESKKVIQNSLGDTKNLHFNILVIKLNSLNFKIDSNCIEEIFVERVFL